MLINFSVKTYFMLHASMSDYLLYLNFTWLVMDTNFAVFTPNGLIVTIPSITASSTLVESRELGLPLRM